MFSPIKVYSPFSFILYTYSISIRFCMNFFSSWFWLKRATYLSSASTGSILTKMKSDCSTSISDVFLSRTSFDSILIWPPTKFILESSIVILSEDVPPTFFLLLKLLLQVPLLPQSRAVLLSLEISKAEMTAYFYLLSHEFDDKEGVSILVLANFYFVLKTIIIQRNFR